MRCAVYTRKSADERADSQLGSIQRQRELCEAYVASQADEGWALLDDRYDDEGWSGANLARPAITRLLAAAKCGELDIVIVYKIDRLSRSLRDFTDLVEKLTSWGVRFVAITQQLDTTTSAGRLMVNVLLSFAQFEREMTSDRLKDWFAGARQRGLWSGQAPYGYRTHRMNLFVVPDDADTVRWLYRRYLKVVSGFQLADEINQKGLLTHKGRSFTAADIYRILNSRVYLGELPHDGGFIKGVHPKVIEEAQWRRVHNLLKRRTWGRKSRSFDRPLFALEGLMFDRHGNRMTTKSGMQQGRVAGYYVPGVVPHSTRLKPEARFRAAELEASVVNALTQIGCAPLPGLGPEWLATALRQMINRVDVQGEAILLTLTSGVTITAPQAGLVVPRPKLRKGQTMLRDKQIKSLYRSGLTGLEVASRLGMSKSGVTAALRRLGVPRRPGGFPPAKRVPPVVPLTPALHIE